MLDVKLYRVDAPAASSCHMVDGVEVVQRVVGADDLAQMLAEAANHAVVFSGFAGKKAVKHTQGIVQGVEQVE